MPPTRAPYTLEYRQRIIELFRTGRTVEQLAKELEPSTTSIRKWIQAAGLDEARPGGAERPSGGGLTPSEKEELERLRREVKNLREEREILKNAAAWFARESSSLPERATRS